MSCLPPGVLATILSLIWSSLLMRGWRPDACASVRVAGAASAYRGSSDLPGYMFREFECSRSCLVLIVACPLAQLLVLSGEAVKGFAMAGKGSLEHLQNE